MASTLPLTIKPEIIPTTNNYEIRMLEANLGGGFVQKAGDGINFEADVLNLKWVGSNTNILELITHFRERAGYQTFTINDSDIVEDVTYKWTCKTYSKGNLSNTVKSLTATLIKDYGLV